MQNLFRSGPMALLIAIGAPVAAQTAVGETLHWQSINGIAQANNVVGTGSGAVTGGGQPWSAQQGRASVDLETGRVSFDVRGLAFAGGNAVGTPGPVTQVKGTLVCDTDGSASGGNSAFVSTPLVDLDDEGNARFDGVLPSLPPVCASETDVAFLITLASGRWIANGTVLR